MSLLLLVIHPCSKNCFDSNRRSAQELPQLFHFVSHMVAGGACLSPTNTHFFRPPDRPDGRVNKEGKRGARIEGGINKECARLIYLLSDHLVS
jgi:hypothetical protein